MSWPLLLLCLVADGPAATPAVHRASASPRQSFDRFQPLTLEELYAKRMRFREGEPMVSIGLMDTQDEVVVGASGPMRLIFEGTELPKTIYAPAQARFRFRVVKSRPAEVRYWVVVETRESDDRAALEAAAPAYERAGQRSHVITLGSIIGLRGQVLDTRQLGLGIGGFPSLASAQALLAELSRTRSDLFIEEELVRLPVGTVGIYDSDGRLTEHALDRVFVQTTPDSRIAADAVEYGRGYAWHNRENRTFRGDMYVVLDRSGRLALVNAVGAEDLLAGLVPAEMFAQAPLEALKAQAVTARGAIFSKIAHRHFGDPFHLCSEQHCQVYSGIRQERPATDRAVRETRGELVVLARKADERLKLVPSFYSASCGGFSESNAVVWGTPPVTSLRAQPDQIASDPAFDRFRAGLDDQNLRVFLESYPPAACARSSFQKRERFRWKKSIQGDELTARLAAYQLGDLTDAQVIGRGAGGRITGLRLVGQRRTAEVLRELPVRQLFGNLMSGLFVLDLERDARGVVRALHFTGGGWGHGVGMCQHGAIGRAELGHDYRQILGHYFGGSVIEAIY